MRLFLVGLPVLLSVSGAASGGPEIDLVHPVAGATCEQWTLTVENKLPYSIEVREPGIRAHGAVVAGEKRTLQMEEGRAEPQVEFSRMGQTLGYAMPDAGLVLADGKVKKNLRLKFECAAREALDTE